MTSATAPVPHAPAAGAAVDPQTLPDHSGQRRAHAQEFFAPPPPQIGTVSSAESTLNQGKRPMPLIVRLLLAAVAAALVLGAFYALASLIERRRDREPVVMLGYIVAGIALIVTVWLTRFKAYCTYVGDRGVVRYTLTRSRDAAPAIELLKFEETDEVYASQTRQYVNGVYTGTSYDYRWTDKGGRQLLRLKGQHRGKNAAPKPGNAWHFANAAEIAWSEHFLDRAQQQLQAEGSIAFRVDKRRVVRVGPGFLEFHFGNADGPTRVTADEIASVSLGEGQFSFKHKDARWYSRAGKYSFAYGSMANGKVFMFALEQLMGYSWQ